MWRLEEHDPEHPLRFATRRLKMPLRDVMRHRAKRTGERYDRVQLWLLRQGIHGLNQGSSGTGQDHHVCLAVVVAIRDEGNPAAVG